MFLHDPAIAPTLRSGIETALDRGTPIGVALDHTEHSLADLWADAGRLADSLRRTGVSPGDRVGVMARNGHTALVTWWAATRCGAILVAFNVDNTGEFLEHQFADSDPAVLVLQPEFLGRVRAALLTVGLGDRPLLVEGGADDPGLLDLGQALAAGDPWWSGPNGDPLDLSHLVYTSGTTGRSQACMIPHTFIRHMALQVADNLERQPEELLWTPMPLFHLSAMTHVTGSVLIGSSVSLGSRFSVSRFWDDVERSGAQVAALMGSMLTLIAQAADSPASLRIYGRLRAVSGSPVTEQLAATWRQRFGVERAGAGTYGMTEAALITTTPPGGYRAGTAARPTEPSSCGSPTQAGSRCPPARSARSSAGRPARGSCSTATGTTRCTPPRSSAPATSTGRTPTAISPSPTAARTTCAAAARTSTASRSSRCSPRTRTSPRSRCTPSPRAQRARVEGDRGPHPRRDAHRAGVLRVVAAPPAAVRRASYIEFRESLPKNPVGRVLKYQLREDGVTEDSWAAPRRRAVSPAE